MTEQTMFETLREAFGNAYAAAGILGNLKAESGLEPRHLQSAYRTILKMTDDSYTEAVDNGLYGKDAFIHDGAGYGLAQWTYYTRKEALLHHAKEHGRSIGDAEMQIGFMLIEIGLDTTLTERLKQAQSVREASDAMLTRYEKPANQGEEAKAKRAAYAQAFYDAYAQTQTTTNTQAGGIPMGYDRQKVIDIARGEIGYLEKGSLSELDSKTANAGSKNYTKYARDMDAIPGFYNGKKQGAAWCDVFVDWCFVRAYGVDDGRALLCQPLKSAGAGCTYSMDYYRAKGRLFSKPEIGDQIFFWDSGKSRIAHTGLVVGVDGGNVVTIEGNTSSSAGVVANGGCVREKKYALGYNRIAGYGRPNYGAGTLRPTDTQPMPDAAPDDAPQGRCVRVTGDTVNLRLGNGTEFSRSGTVSGGTLLQWIATAVNGWHAVLYKKQVVWISGRYSELMPEEAKDNAGVD